MTAAYINSAGVYLPGKPVTNSEMTDYLGSIDDQSVRLGRLILRQNKIETRYYVERNADGFGDTNATMAANAVEKAVQNSDLNDMDIELLATATTQGDLIVPGHGSAVHAELAKLLKTGSLEVASFQSVCASSMMAAKTAMMNVQMGLAKAAVAVGSEFSSRWFQPGFYQAAMENLEDKEVRMAAEFLRWTLSDGAGAIILQNHASDHAPSFHIDWIENISFADRFDTCMYAGVKPSDRFQLERVWSHYSGGPMEAAQSGAIMLLQDMVLLKRIIRAWVGEYLTLVDAGKVIPDKVDHLLCHYSAHSLREEIIKIMKSTGGMIDEDKWFSNLSTKGNTGSAALFIMLEEFMKKQIAKPGEKILCIVPESGRAMISFMMLTAQ